MHKDIHSGKSKYEVAVEIAEMFDLSTQCKKKAGYIEDEDTGRLIPQDLDSAKEALDEYQHKIQELIGILS